MSGNMNSENNYGSSRRRDSATIFMERFRCEVFDNTNDDQFVEHCVQRMKDMSKNRMARIRKIKAQIEAGTYYSDEKFAETVRIITQNER